MQCASVKRGAATLPAAGGLPLFHWDPSRPARSGYPAAGRQPCTPTLPRQGSPVPPLTWLLADLLALLQRFKVVGVPPAATVDEGLAGPRGRAVDIATVASPAWAMDGREVTDVR